MGQQHGKQLIGQHPQSLRRGAGNQRHADAGEKEDKACLTAPRVGQGNGILRNHRCLRLSVGRQLLRRLLIPMQRLAEALRQNFPSTQLRVMVQQQQQLTVLNRAADLFNQLLAA